MSDLYSEHEKAKLEERFAVIYTPKRQRNRFAENCVQVVDSEQAALAAAQGQKGLHPAKVVGPSRSSEGFQLYYLVQWLEH